MNYLRHVIKMIALSWFRDYDDTNLKKEKKIRIIQTPLNNYNNAFLIF